MVAVASVSAADNATADDVASEEVVIENIAIDSQDDGVADNNGEVLKSENTEMANDTLATDNDDELSTDDSSEVLGSTSPEYTDYNVEFQKYSYSWSWATGGTINVNIEPVDEPYYYDFYFQVFDSKGNQIKNQNIYSSNSEDRDFYNEYYYKLTVDPKSETFTPGTYTLKLVNYKDGHEFDSVPLKVLKGNGKITITQAGKYATNKKLTIKVIDTVSKKPIANQRVDLTFSNGKKTFVRTNSKGLATYYMNTFKPGNYFVKATAKSNSITFPTTTKRDNIKIVKTPVTLNPRQLTTPYASGKYFNIKVTDSAKKPVGAVKLKVNIFTGSSKKTINLKTISTGWAKYAASRLSIGTHKVVVSVASTALHVGSTKASSITVKKAGVAINAPKGTMNPYKKTGFYRVRLTNYATGEPLSGVTVTMKVYTGSSFKVFKAQTNANGIASITTRALSNGKHDVVVSYGGSAYYKASTAKGAVTISPKIPTHFDIDRSDLRYDSVTLYNSYGLPSSTYITAVYVPVVLKDNNGNEIIKKVTLTNDRGTESCMSGERIRMGGASDITLRFAGDASYMPCTYVLTI